MLDVKDIGKSSYDRSDDYAQKQREVQKANEKKKEQQEISAMSPEDFAAITTNSHALGESIAMSIISSVIG